MLNGTLNGNHLRSQVRLPVWSSSDCYAKLSRYTAVSIPDGRDVEL